MASALVICHDPLIPMKVDEVVAFHSTQPEEPDMALRIGDDAPDFTAETTEGTIRFHEWIGDG
ncbi:MAG: hypothetical protein ACT4PS_00710, partial [Betaproteobacteria bacterium]